MADALFFLVKTITQLYLLTYLIRFVMQWVRADFYNPLSQFIVRVTNPLVVPARRLVPSAGGIDVATLVVMLALEALFTWVLMTFVGLGAAPATFVLYVVLRLVALTIMLYTVVIIVYAVMSFIGPGYATPLSLLLAQLVEPVLRPFRRVIPPVGGLDLSPLVVLILLQAVVIALPLPAYLR